MQPLPLLLHLLLIVSIAAQSPPAPPPAPESQPPPAPAPGVEGSTPAPAPARNPLSPPAPPPPDTIPNPNGNPSPAPAPNDQPSNSEGSNVTWCAVREEYDACLKYTSLIPGPLNWTCVAKENKGECMDAIKNGEADLISLEAGYAYMAFLNKSMKAILSEEYSFHAQSYGAVAVVNKYMCDRNSRLSLEDLRNFKSCHPGYQTSGGWNYPVYYLLKMGIDPRLKNDSSDPNDVKTINSFFSESCAPSELGHGGLCSACGNTSSCSSIDNIYAGETGAFRCLMDGTGDIAFLRAKTATMYSSDGVNRQAWSSKSVSEFMYLCPGGGCKPINENYGDCVFATVPANPLMTRNNITGKRRDAIIQALLNANWTSQLYMGNNWQNYLLSVSTQALAKVSQLTRQYLSTSGNISQIVLDINNNILSLSGSPKKTSIPSSVISLALGAVTSGILYSFLEIL
ncbi:hypothetical protein MPTK1_6g17580 [Marchantia polymorpha subsp. ruderalis]|uniref:Transferrin-like domain-containing protein n=2 Tax=Marchantia polymorpha TaxID=3197 RepID=A0AAF6BT38_MARPO|nr:hypothetical protein MARPO_0145s0028 [Marchantia polymorpha]BBN15172.1 hypothetical protein Mp_6g17580 [Marchantia polymorpha subsp. ruderalis]|eukprot:PTQ29263.1 hypothetical protein MARPO_0145s0028 [Marchantia polymorpha]